MKKVTDVIREIGPIFSDSEEDFSIPKVKQPIVGEENSIYSYMKVNTQIYIKAVVYCNRVSVHLSTQVHLCGTNREKRKSLRRIA